MSIKISFSQAVELAQMAIADKGETYVYRRPRIIGQPDAFYGRCAYYLGDGKPSCIVGHILHRLGVVFSATEQKNYWGFNELVVGDVVTCDMKTHTFLYWLQSNQDTGIPWGLAFEMALKRVQGVCSETRIPMQREVVHA